MVVPLSLYLDDTLGDHHAFAEKNAEKAYKYLISNIADNGAMTEGSDGTSVRDEMEIYKNTRKKL